MHNNIPLLLVSNPSLYELFPSVRPMMCDIIMCLKKKCFENDNSKTKVVDGVIHEMH